MSGRPPTGRTRTRSPEMSVTLGATTTWTGSCLQVPDDPAHLGGRARAPRRRRRSRRRRTPSTTRGGIVGVAEHRDAGVRLLARRRAPGSARRPRGSPATTRGAGRWRSRRRAPGEPAITTRCSRAPRRRARVDRAAQQEPPEHRAGMPTTKASTKKPARQLELGQVAADPDRPGRDQARVEDALVLVGAGAERAVAVAAAEADGDDPAQDDQRSNDAEACWRRVTERPNRRSCSRPIAASRTDTGHDRPGRGRERWAESPAGPGWGPTVSSLSASDREERHSVSSLVALAGGSFLMGADGPLGAASAPSCPREDCAAIETMKC